MGNIRNNLEKSGKIWKINDLRELERSAGASHFLGGFVFLPLLHMLVEERVGVRRCL
jgi:hypothetical protein